MNVLAFNLGVILQALLVLALLSAGVSLELVWRLALACGAVPSILAFGLRLQMHEPTEVSPSLPTRGARSGHWQDIQEALVSKCGILFGACICWMLFNFVG